MSKKIETLKEVNAQLKALLSELETKMFIENINDAKVNVVKTEEPKVVLELK